MWDGSARRERVADVTRGTGSFAPRWRFPRSFPRDRVFFDLFSEAGQNTLRAARLLQRDARRTGPTRTASRATSCRPSRRATGSPTTSSSRLNSTFVTPIDREDIYGLATKLDDIVDYIEETADFLGLYRIEAPMEQAHDAGRRARRSRCEQLAGGARGPARLQGPRAYWIEIHRLENEGDRLYRDAVASLFANGIDPMVVIRWKDIFPRLERGDRRDRDRRPHPRGHRDQERVSG